jgi:hypothetical protein
MALVGILSTQLLHHQFVTHSPYASPVSKNLDDVRIISAPKTRAAAGYAGRSEIIALGDIK